MAGDFQGAASGGLPPVPQLLLAWQIICNTINLNPDESILYELTVNHLRFTEAQYVCVRDKGGYGTLADFNQWRYKDIRKWCETMSSGTVRAGGRTFVDFKVKQLQGIAWCVTDFLLRNSPLDAN